MVAAPSRARRTQPQRSADSRELILDAAVACLMEDGYEATTTVSIQGRAGVSRGRLLHHFPSREALLIAAAHHLATEQLAEVERRIELAPQRWSTGPDRIDQATAALWHALHQRSFLAAMELWNAARTNDALRAELLEAERRLTRGIDRVIAGMYGPDLAAHPRFEDVKELLFTSMRGVALSYALHQRDPSSDPHLRLWTGIAHELLDPADRYRHT